MTSLACWKSNLQGQVTKYCCRTNLGSGKSYSRTSCAGRRPSRYVTASVQV